MVKLPVNWLMKYSQKIQPWAGKTGPENLVRDYQEWTWKVFKLTEPGKNVSFDLNLHTAWWDPTFIQIYMDAPQGVSKEPKGQKDQYLDVFLC